MNDVEATEKLVKTLRKMYPEIDVYARGHSLSKCRELRKLGASGAVSETLETSLELARMALEKASFDNVRQEEILSDFRKTYYSKIDESIQLEDTKTREK